MKTVKTPEQFKLQFQTLHPTLELLSDYINSTSTIKVKCKICGKKWTPRADTLKKIKCTTCEKSNKYKQQIAQINPNIEILMLDVKFGWYSILVSIDCLEGGVKLSSKGISMKFLVQALNAQFGVCAGS